MPKEQYRLEESIDELGGETVCAGSAFYSDPPFRGQVGAATRPGHFGAFLFS
jgi:hypothetical protein